MNTRIKKLEKEDALIFQQLVLVFREEFEMNFQPLPGISHLAKLLSDPAFMVFVALHEDEVIGGLTAYELRSYHTESAEVFIYDLAVKQQFKRKGAGSRLMAAVRQYCGTNKISGLFVSGHEEDSHAIHFYEANGGIPEKVMHFNFSIKTNDMADEAGLLRK